MADHQNHGRVRLRSGDGVNGEDTIGVTLWGDEFSMPAAEWSEIAARISAKAPRMNGRNTRLRNMAMIVAGAFLMGWASGVITEKAIVSQAQGSHSHD